MGCDIHAHIEIKVRGEWYYYNELNINRNYELFEKMAGVRGEIENAIDKPRGLPKDISFMTKLKSDLWDTDGHTHSWLSGKELAELEEWTEKKEFQERYNPIFDYLFGNSFSGWFKYPEDQKRERSFGIEDFRLIFWFDN